MNIALKATLKLFGVLALGLGLAHPAQAQTLKSVRLTAGLSAPLYACAAPGDTSRIFIVQQGGLIRILKNGTLLRAADGSFDALLTVDQGVEHQ